MSGPAFQLLGLALFALILAVAAVGDVRTYRIPNRLCAALALAGIIFVLPLGPQAWASHAASFGVVAAVVFTLWLLRGMGGGDVKLLAAAALWIPFSELSTFVLLLAVAGGLQALVTLVARRVKRPPAGATPAERRRMPYALSIAAAGWLWAGLLALSSARA